MSSENKMEQVLLVYLNSFTCLNPENLSVFRWRYRYKHAMFKEKFLDVKFADKDFL